MSRRLGWYSWYVEEETPVVADFSLSVHPSVLSPCGVVLAGVPLAVFRALFPGVSLGGPGNRSLGLHHVLSECKGCRF